LFYKFSVVNQLPRNMSETILQRSFEHISERLSWRTPWTSAEESCRICQP